MEYFLDTAGKNNFYNLSRDANVMQECSLLHVVHILLRISICQSLKIIWILLENLEDKNSQNISQDLCFTIIFNFHQ